MSEEKKKVPRGRGRPFKAGQSGNPAGRPKGSKNLTKLLLERLDDRAELLIDAIIDRALKGDGAATKIIAERAMPAQKGMLVDFELPERRPDGSMDPVKVQESFLEAVASGKITPADAANLSIIFDRMMAAKNELLFEQKVLATEQEVMRIAKMVK